MVREVGLYHQTLSDCICGQYALMTTPTPSLRRDGGRNPDSSGLKGAPPLLNHSEMTISELRMKGYVKRTVAD